MCKRFLLSALLVVTFSVIDRAQAACNPADGTGYCIQCNLDHTSSSEIIFKNNNSTQSGFKYIIYQRSSPGSSWIQIGGTHTATNGSSALTRDYIYRPRTLGSDYSSDGRETKIEATIGGKTITSTIRGSAIYSRYDGGTAHPKGCTPVNFKPGTPSVRDNRIFPTLPKS